MKTKDLGPGWDKHTKCDPILCRYNTPEEHEAKRASDRGRWKAGDGRVRGRRKTREELLAEADELARVK